mgnify:FL=1
MTKPFQDVIDKQCPDCGVTGCGINFEQTQKLSAVGVAKRFKKDVSKLTDLEKWSGYRESMKRRKLDPDCVTCRGTLHWSDMTASRFKRYRQGLGLSIVNIAELADVEPRTVRKWETKTKPPEDVVDIIFNMEWLVIAYINQRKNEPENKPLLYDFMREWDKILPDFQTDTYYRIWVSTLERRWNEYLRVILCAKWFSQ